MHVFQRYYFSVIATNAVGSTAVSSDGVVVWEDGIEIPGIKVSDWQSCIGSNAEIDENLLS